MAFSRSPKKSGKKPGKLAIAFALAVVGTVLIGALTGLTAIGKTIGSHIGYSDGDRVGIVQKFSYKGVLCKSWEGAAAMPGFTSSTDSNGNRSTTNLFEFSVNSGDTKIIAQLKDALQNPTKKYDLGYHQTVTGPFCGKKTSYTITSVKPAGTANPTYG